MVLKNKDGTDYKLSGPNPLMKSQILWNAKQELIKYNKFGQLKILTSNQQESIKTETAIEEFDVKTFETEMKEASKEETPEIVERLPEVEVGKRSDEGVVEVWCLPKLGEVYGEKFKFESVILENSDLYFVLYTNVKLTPGSILYPRIFDKRWWRVKNIKEEAENEYLVSAMISYYQPNFS